MSYYRPSYSQTVAMSRGGRGYSSSRGSSYRGSSRGSSSWVPRGSGYHGSSRGGSTGRFSSSFSSSFESRSKYPSSDRYSSSSRGHHSDDYRKPYNKHESGGYSTRDHRSPDRKRMRTESNHDRNFGGGSGGGGDYNNHRYESSDRRSFSGDRRAPAPFTRNKEEFRKPAPPGSPRGGGGGYRGRVSSRGTLRTRLRERPARMRLVESSYGVKKRVLRIGGGTGGGSSSAIHRSSAATDYARRLKISRLRSSIRRRKEEDESEKEESDMEDEEIEKKLSKIESSKNDSENEADDVDVKPAKQKTSPKKDADEPIDETSDALIKKEGSDEVEDDSEKPSFIKLTCPHCLTRCATFGKYTLHLQSGRHAAAMRRVAMKQKSILSQMRLVQRKSQRELEKTTDDLAMRTSWCPLCKLNYKQPKATHQESEQHKDMKKFLMPFCKICKITFKSPMISESHACSINHIKRKQLLANGDKSEKEDGSANEDDPMENFMTIDSVGDMDDEAAEVDKKEGITSSNAHSASTTSGAVAVSGGGEGTKSSKEHINVGIENIRKVEVQYCDLCRMYLPRSDDEEMPKIISRHCKQRTHLQRYIRFKEDKELARRAERLQRKETAEKAKDKPVDEIKEEKEKPEVKATENNVKKDETSLVIGTTTVEDDKIWADVDNILAEAGKSSDEDEEDSMVNGERYDRFKYSEKANEELKKKEAAAAEDEKKDELAEEIKA